MRCDGPPGGRCDHGAAGDVKPAPMPGAGHDMAIHLALTERSAHVSALVVQRMKRTPQVKQREDEASRLDDLSCPGRNVLDLSYLDHCHLASPPSQD